MKKLSFLFLVALPLGLSAAEVVRGPYVEDPTLTTAVIRWSTNVPSSGWVEYGPAPKCSQIMTVSPTAIDHKVVLHGLVSNKDFCYKIYVENNAGDGVQGPLEGKFTTMYSPERKVVKFIIFGNTAGGEALAPALAARLNTYSPDFYIHTGDLVSSGLVSDSDTEFFRPYGALLAKAPMFIAVGEKEYGIDMASKDSKGFFRANYSRLHTMTWGKGSPNYYYFDTANARFIFLDTSFEAGAVHAPAINADSAQYAWLKNTLATTEPGTWKVVVMHNPAYSTGAKGSNMMVRDAFSDLFEYYGVNVVLQGDDFNYERTFPVKDGEESASGVPYLTFGTGAAPIITKRESKEPWTARFLSAQVYGVGEIVDRKLTIKVYNVLDDKLVETADFYLRAN